MYHVYVSGYCLFFYDAFSTPENHSRPRECGQDIYLQNQPVCRDINILVGSTALKLLATDPAAASYSCTPYNWARNIVSVRCMLHLDITDWSRYISVGVGNVRESGVMTIGGEEGRF